MAQLYHIQNVREFHELDELEITPPPVCLRCKGCRECTFCRWRLTPDEQEVVSWVESEMKIDSILGIITVSYPWKNCMQRMVDNRCQAQKVQETMERHMMDVSVNYCLETHLESPRSTTLFWASSEPPSALTSPEAHLCNQWGQQKDTRRFYGQHPPFLCLTIARTPLSNQSIPLEQLIRPAAH